MKIVFFLSLLCFAKLSFAQSAYKIAVLKYKGGGDYYANPSSVPNLVKFCNSNLKTDIDTDVPYVDVGSPDLFDYPFVHMTGHGNVVFTNSELDNLRNYLAAGGFLHIDDNYGMDQYIRAEIKKLFPNSSLIELPSNHPIFHQKYNFNGLPKIHEHDGERPQAFGIVLEGKLVLLYTFQTDLGDGWEDQNVHNDSSDKRKEALQMGANILMYVFSR